MKKIVDCEQEEGLISLLGEQVILFCLNYIYVGKLVGVNDTCVKLENPAIAYETGAFDARKYKNAQRLMGEFHYIQTEAIESFGRGK
jgi:hypothetical protein